MRSAGGGGGGGGGGGVLLLTSVNFKYSADRIINHLSSKA